MIGNIRSYCSRNKTIQLATRNRHHYDIYDISSDYRYKNFYVSAIGSSNALHYQGGTLAFHNNWMGYFANNVTITLHDIAH